MRRATPPEPGGKAHLVVHASTIPIPAKRADYGAGIVHLLGDDDVFVALIEFGEEAIGSALFPEVDAIPRVHPNDFKPEQLQRRIVGQAGTQVFFTFEDRAFCFYIVLGSHSRRIPLAGRVNGLIRSLKIERRP